ncbi:MAG: HD domain-containing protein [Treponema sp.]|nr:HD domain-containing protein [Treponema sp.]MCL2271879.1 HD domain-containing protein [Treponema sp.]
MIKTIEASLTEGYTHPVRDVLWGHVYMTDKQALLTQALPFLKLSRIFQLGPVYQVYPGATHTRASHSIGVYHLGRRLLQNLAERGASLWLTDEGVKSFMAACLLHDIGHFPYTHSLKELPLISHETLTGSIILTEPLKSLVADTGADPYLTAAIVDKGITEIKSDELFFYRKLLSGALDPDKLDYLNRDARYCGVPYGAQDVDFILSRLYPDKERGADIDSRLIPNVESILFSKYLMYRTVYWHRNVRSATAMVKKAILNGLESKKISGEQLYNLDDTGLFTLLEEKTDDQLIKNVHEGRIFITFAEIPHDQIDITAMRDIKYRSQAEKKIEAVLGIKDIIIDIPEPVSFETGLFVIDENCSFSGSSSAFKSELVNAFIKTLYTVRVFIDKKYKNTLKTFSDSCDIIKQITEGE